jgi:excisionase family DNA binding protein
MSAATQQPTQRRLRIERAGAPLLYSLDEAAARIGIGMTKLNELIAAGSLSTITIGRRRLVPAEDLTEFVSELRATAARKV